MIAVPNPIAEPETFDEDCRKKGLAWLKSKAGDYPDRPIDYWSAFRGDLRRAFGRRCGYYALYLHDGSVDHYVSWAECKKSGEVAKAYDWDNLRFIDGGLNSKKKQHADLLAPFEVGEGWFYLELPSLNLKIGQIPNERQQAARDTLEKLGLADGERVLELRWEYYNAFYKDEITMPWLETVAPLVAAAVQAWKLNGMGPIPKIGRPVKDYYDFA